MQVIHPGHKYWLNDFNGNPVQELSFMTDPGALNGTTSEEVLKALIDRFEVLHEALPSVDNRATITHLKSALSAQERRTADRVRRRVEGTYAA